MYAHARGHYLYTRARENLNMCFVTILKSSIGNQYFTKKMRIQLYFYC